MLTEGHTSLFETFIFGMCSDFLSTEQRACYPSRKSVSAFIMRLPTVKFPAFRDPEIYLRASTNCRVDF